MDLIDREQLMNYIRSRKINIGKLAHDVIMKQPSIQPQESKTGQGKWIEERTYMECPHCHDIWHYEENQTERFKYCPTCGERIE